MTALRRLPMRALAALATLVFLSTCARETGRMATLRFSIAPARAVGRSTPFSCYGLMVNGSGIASNDPNDPRESVSPNQCTYPAVSTPFVATGASIDLQLAVPAGTARLVQVVGLDLGDASACPTGTVSDFVIAARAQQASALLYGGLYEVGRAQVDVSDDTQVEITTSYDPANGLNLRTCNLSEPNADLLFEDLSLTLQQGGTRVLSVNGGFPPYSVSPQHGTIASGRYTAPASGASDTVRVTDNRGNFRVLDVTLFNASTLTPTPAYWYDASSYLGTLNDGDDIYTQSAAWMDAGSRSRNLAPAATGVVFKAAGGPNNFPTINFAGSNFSANDTLTSVPSLQAFIVSERSSTNTGPQLCLPLTDCTSGTYFLMAYNSGEQATVQSSTQIDTTSAVSNPGGFVILESHWAGGASPDIETQIIGGSSGHSSTNNVSSLYFAGTSHLYLGSNGSTGLFAGNIAEVLIFTGVLSVSDASAVTSYLKAKYAL